VERLVLWDIDQTLVTVNGVSAGFFPVVLRALTGRELRQTPDMGGKTDRQLVNAVLASVGIEPSEELIEAFYDGMAGLAHERVEEMRANGRALAGAVEAVTALCAAPGVVQTVVTGNIEPVARLKLELFGLAGPLDLDVGGYGSHSVDRRDMVDFARTRATHKYGQELDGDHVTVIGDTVHDVAGALASGTRAIGVATGRTRPEELHAAGAHIVLPSLADTAALLDAVLCGR
jgi:phosphoglycolate phosphatase-like HAD superfamily hydrolase